MLLIIPCSESSAAHFAELLHDGKLHDRLESKQMQPVSLPGWYPAS